MQEAHRRAGGLRRVFVGAAMAVAAVLIGVGLYGLLIGSRSADPRPRGSLEDVLALRERSDLNVLFVLVDTLRADRLGAYGYARDTSPYLDALAASGIRFAGQTSQSSWTKCSMASLWTGLYPVRTRVLRAYDMLTHDARMPAEIFQEAGFRTAGIWRNGWIAPNFGFAQGFEIYLSPNPSGANRNPLRRLENPNITVAGSDADILNSAIEFLRAHGHERWFLYLHMMDVHQYAYSEDTALFGTSYSDSYDNSIRWIDSLLGHLFAALDSRGLRDRTLIVFSSDHGEAFGEHDGEGHARNVYGEVITTPLILGLPFRLEPGIVVESISENVDLWPTVLELVGLPGLPDTDGRSLMPEIGAAARGEAGNDSGVAIAQIDQSWARANEAPRPMIALRDGRWRLIYRAVRPGTSELYDKWQDPLEQRDVAAEQTEVFEALKAKASAYLESPPPPWGGDGPTTVEVDEMLMNQLRALGYGVQ